MKTSPNLTATPPGSTQVQLRRGRKWAIRGATIKPKHEQPKGAKQ